VPPVAATVVAVYATPTIPAGGVIGVIVSGVTTAMGRLTFVVRWLGLVESVTVITAVLFPAGPVGVPVITPAALIESPAGKPVAVKVYGAVPPLALTVVAVYATPTTPAGSEVVVIASGVTIVIGRLAVAVEWVGVAESVTVMAAVLVAAGPLGVPVIKPAVLIESPAGKPVAVKVNGATPPLARTCALYAVPTVPLGSMDVVIVTPNTTVI